jgi:hypothetical protein
MRPDDVFRFAVELNEKYAADIRQVPSELDSHNIDVTMRLLGYKRLHPEDRLQLIGGPKEAYVQVGDIEGEHIIYRELPVKERQ